MKASIIIPTAGQRIDYLNDTLVSAQKQDLPAFEFEIIVVDNSKNTEVRKAVDNINLNNLHPVRYVREELMGLHYARHAGANSAGGEILVYIDDDVIAPSHWLKALAGVFNNPQIACAGGKILPKWEGVVPAWYAQFDSAYLSLLDLGETAKELKEPNIWGCNMAVRKSVLFEIGGFNPDGIGDKRSIWLRGDGECGLENKILKRGLKLFYEPQAWLYHRIPPSRLTPEYFYWRLFIQGIDDSYRYLRIVYQRPLFILHVIIQITYSFARAAQKFFFSILKSKQNVRMRADAYYWWGRGQHLSRTLLSKPLRDHVLQGSYL